MSARWLVLLLFFSFLTLTFLLVTWLDWQLLLDPGPRLRSMGWAAALVSGGLLAGDAFLPLPSSVLLLANGYLFGPVWGTVVSVVGLMLGNAAGFLAARYAGQWLEQKFPSSRRTTTRSFLDRWGKLALIVSRPVPVLAESILFLSAATTVTFRSAMGSCLLGTVPLSVAYSLVGHYALKWSEPLLILSIAGLLLAVPACFVLAGKLSRVSKGSVKIFF